MQCPFIDKQISGAYIFNSFFCQGHVPLLLNRRHMHIYRTLAIQSQEAVTLPQIQYLQVHTGRKHCAVQIG